MTTHTITKKVFAPKCYFSMDALHAGLGLETLMLMHKGSPEHDVEVGTAVIQITLHDRPIYGNKEELIAERKRLMAEASDQLNAINKLIEEAS